MDNRELMIGNVKLDGPFVLAPLAGITDAPTRRICREMGASLVYTEMVSAKGLWYNDKNTAKLLFTYPDEVPVAVQIFGSEPEIMAFAAKKLDVPDYAIIDVNMGCPVPKVVKNGEGSALLKDPDLIYDIISAMTAATSKPVTAKIRIGFDSGSINCVEVAKALEAAGAAAVAVHGRTREQYYSGKADWKEIAKVKADVSIPVIGNGDVTDSDSALRMMDETGCDFVMVGRAALGDPWIFRRLNARWQNMQALNAAQTAGVAENRADAGDYLEVPTDIVEKKEMMIRQFHDMIEVKGEYAAVREMRKFVGWYLKGVHGSAALRGRVNQISSAEELTEAIRSF